MAKQKYKGIEYRMLIQPTYDETLKKNGTMFLIETVKQFSNFSYEVVVEESLKDNQVTWALHGLRAPELLMPSFGGAQFRKVYYDLMGTYAFTLKKIDGEANEFSLKILASSVTVREGPPKPFVSLYTSEDLFEGTRDQESEKPHHKPDVKRSSDRPLQKKKE